MSVEVELRKLNSDGKTLQSNNDAGKFLNYFIIHAPMAGRDIVEDVWFENDVEDDSERWFGEVEVVSYEEREERR